MDLFQLTRALVDIESVTNNEKQVGDFLFAELSALASKYAGRVERIAAAPDRDNIFTSWGDPVVTLSTHMDTVPPFFASREDDEFIWGRGSCDAKGIIAAMIAAAERLLAAGTRGIALLFLVGEERNSLGAKAAAAVPRGSRFLVNGEPTENHLALGCKGVLRFEIVARGKLAHSAYPHLGHSAIHALLDVLGDIRAMALPADAVLGPATLNVGVIAGGRAPNVVADEARAEIMFRTVGDPGGLREVVAAAARGRADAREVIHIPAVHLTNVNGFKDFMDLPATAVAFATDIPALGAGWGQPFLIGPGSIHVAHTAEERIPKKELVAAVDIYSRMVMQLLASAGEEQVGL
jgi:acetylornithine deacetylase